MVNVEWGYYIYKRTVDCVFQARRLILSWRGSFPQKVDHLYIYIIDSEFCVVYWQCNNFSFLQHAFIKKHQ